MIHLSKKILISFMSLLILLSISVSTKNVSASHHYVKVYKYNKIKKHNLTKNQKIKMEHKYFYISMRNINNPKWYYKYSPSIYQYIDYYNHKHNTSNGKYYTNRAKSFMAGYNDAQNDPVTMRHAFKRRNTNPISYKEGWIIGNNEDEISTERDYNKRNFINSLSEYNFLQYGPNNTQRNKWAKIERKYLTPTRKEVNSPKWYLTHYKKAIYYYNKHDKSNTSKPSDFITYTGKSFDKGFNDISNSEPILKKFNHIDSNSYKAGYIIGSYYANDMPITKHPNIKTFNKLINGYNTRNIKWDNNNIII